MSYHFPLAMDDNMWFFEMSPKTENSSTDPDEELYERFGELLKDPVSFVKENCSPDIEFAIGPVVLVFQYGPFVNGTTYCVHGVDNTNMISVRCPSISDTDHPLEGLEIDGPKVEVVFLESPQIAFAHFDPTDKEGLPYKEMGKIIVHPTLLPRWLNAQPQQQGQETRFVRKSEGSVVTETEPVKWKTRFILSDSYRFRYETYFHLGSAPPREDDPVYQCTKLGGAYTPFEEDGMAVVQIDEAWQTLWQEPTPPPPPPHH